MCTNGFLGNDYADYICTNNIIVCLYIVQKHYPPSPLIMIGSRWDQ